MTASLIIFCVLNYLKRTLVSVGDLDKTKSLCKTPTVLTAQLAFSNFRHLTDHWILYIAFKIFRLAPTVVRLFIQSGPSAYVDLE